jgi:hypothetical protein
VSVKGSAAVRPKLHARRRSRRLVLALRPARRSAFFPRRQLAARGPVGPGPRRRDGAGGSDSEGDFVHRLGGRADPFAAAGGGGIGVRD